MGFYVEIKDSDFLIPTKHLDAAFTALKELNKNDSLKNGGNGQGNKWFAWMDPEYDKKAKDARHIFDMLRFDSLIVEDGLWIYDYDSKWGSEDHFMHAVAPFVIDGSVILWVGEDHEYFIDAFHDSKHLRLNLPLSKVEAVYTYLAKRRSGQKPPISEITNAFD